MRLGMKGYWAIPVIFGIALMLTITVFPAMADHTQGEIVWLNPTDKVGKIVKDNHCLDNDFTELFDSKKFGENYGKLMASELELSKHWEKIVNVMLQSANLPNKKEIDEVYKELHTLRKRVSKLESEVKTRKKVGK